MRIEIIELKKNLQTTLNSNHTKNEIFCGEKNRSLQTMYGSVFLLFACFFQYFLRFVSSALC